MRKTILLVLALLLIAGCSKKANLFIGCSVTRFQTWSDAFWGDRGGTVLSDPILEELTAAINDDTMEVELPGPGNDYQDARFWDEDTIPQAAGSEQKFDIRTDVGNATATCTVPGEFDITAPLEGDSIPLNADYDITWVAADGADWYMVQIYYSWAADDKDTLVYVDSATTWAVPAGWITEDGSMAVYVYAGDGPKVDIGAAGNIKGAKGFCIATNARANQAIVGAGWFLAPAHATEARRMSSGDLYRTYIKEMSKYSSEAAEMLDYLK